MTYDQAVKIISKLPSKGDANMWIRLTLAQFQDLISRAASPKCAERRRQQLLARYQTYLEMKGKE